MSALDIQNLSLSYGHNAVLKNASLSIENGEVFALLGSNGAGKSTTIKAILDFVDIDQGHILIKDIPHTKNTARQPLAFLPEKFTPPYFTSGQQFIEFTFSAHNRRTSTHKVKQYCDMLSFDYEKLKQPIRSYSKGMSQKLGLIATLSLDKPLYIFDEPMSGLDPGARAQVRSVFSKMREEGKTLFFCSHMLADIEDLCDRIAILHQGQLIFVGSPEECKHHYHADNLDQAFLKATDFFSQTT